MSEEPTGTNARADVRLDDELERLPPLTASPGFTARVIEALDRGAEPSAPPIRRWALAAAALLAIAVGFLLGSRPEPPAAEVTAERELLRQEYGELVQELETLRSMADQTRPRLYLGSGADLDLVLDLSPLVEAQTPTARPATQRDTDPAPRYY